MRTLGRLGICDNFSRFPSDLWRTSADVEAFANFQRCRCPDRASEQEFTDEDVTTKKKERKRERERKRARERGTELSFGKKNLQASLSVKWRVLGY